MDINFGLSVTATGTVDVITATASPAPASLTDKLKYFVTALGANTSTTPTFAPNGLTAHTITKLGGQPLLAGDIPSSGSIFIIEYNLANTRWELLNPAAPAYSSGTWAPSFTGFSTDPSNITARYILIGKLCFIHMFPASAGTSNATTFTITLPFAAANTSVNYSSQVIINNNVQQAGRLLLTANSNIGTMQLVSGAAWTASGVKTCFLMMTYEIA